jgi:hypothetical protein
MRSLLNTAAVVTAAIALGGCPDKRPEPVPGPQSTPAQSTPTSGEARDSNARSVHMHARGASEISWFQGTLEEAFSPRTCREHRAWLRY